MNWCYRLSLFPSVGTDSNLAVRGGSNGNVANSPGLPR
jgi:hypothetical protein